MNLWFRLDILCRENICTFTFSHLADAFIQSDLQGCIHIFTFTLMAHCTSGAIMGFSVLLKDASTGRAPDDIPIFSRRFYPKRLTSMYTHFYIYTDGTLHIRSNYGVQCLAQGRFDRESNLATFCLLNDFSTYCTTVAPIHGIYTTNQYMLLIVWPSNPK